jgi:hypothetical protein
MERGNPSLHRLPLVGYREMDLRGDIVERYQFTRRYSFFLENSEAFDAGSGELPVPFELSGVAFRGLCHFERLCFLVQVDSLLHPHPEMEQFDEFVGGSEETKEIGGHLVRGLNGEDDLTGIVTVLEDFKHSAPSREGMGLREPLECPRKE